MTFREIFHLVVQTLFVGAVVFQAYAIYRNALIVADQIRRIVELQDRVEVLESIVSALQASSPSPE